MLMSFINNHRFYGIVTLALMAMFTLVASCPVMADTILIEFDGLDVEYAGSEIFDADPGAADPDPVSDTTIDVGGIEVFSSAAGVTVDLSIPGVLGIDVGAGTDTVLSAGGGTLDMDFGGGEFLSLLLEPVNVIYVDAGFLQFVIGATIATVDDQMLPAGLAFGDSVTVDFKVDIDPSSLTDDGTSLTGFIALGSGTIEGELGIDPMSLPEPATVVLALFGLVAMSLVSFTNHDSR